MLDELRDYQSYTTVQTADDPPCLRYCNLANYLSGIERAMTVVARGALFSGCFPQGFDRTATDVACAKACLRSWCGLPRTSKAFYRLTRDGQWEPMSFEAAAKADTKGYLCRKNCLGEEVCIQKAPEDTPEQAWEKISAQFPTRCFRDGSRCAHPCKAEILRLYNWFPNYLYGLQVANAGQTLPEQAELEERVFRHWFPAPGTKATAPNAAEIAKALSGCQSKRLSMLCDLHNKKTQFAQRVFHSSLADPGKGKNKEITYERILANALNDGPLQRYVLYTSKPVDRPEALLAGIQKTGKSPDKPAKPSKANQRLILAIAAVYLMRKKPGQTFVPFNNADFTNWLQGNFPKSGGLACFSYEGRPLFRKSIVAGNLIKLSIDPGWLADSGLGVAPEAQVPPGVSRISCRHIKTNSQTGNSFDLVFCLKGGTLT